MAACAASRITQPGARALQDRGIKLLRTAETKDAADHALIKEARHRAEDGCRRFIVAFSDNRFAALADLGTLEIILWKAQKSATKYTSRAAKVHRVARPDTAAVPPATSAASPGYAETAARIPPARPVPATESALPATPARRIRPAHVAAAAAGVTAVGLLFGAGGALRRGRLAPASPGWAAACSRAGRCETGTDDPVQAALDRGPASQRFVRHSPPSSAVAELTI